MWREGEGKLRGYRKCPDFGPELLLFHTFHTRDEPGRGQALFCSDASESTRIYSMTSSAIAINEGGTVTPSARAALRLMTSSNFVGCMTGRSAGFSPLRMRPT